MQMFTTFMYRNTNVRRLVDYYLLGVLRANRALLRTKTTLMLDSNIGTIRCLLWTYRELFE